MTVRPILPLSDPSLRRQALPVNDVQAVQYLVDDLLDTLYATRNGVGMAANQIGETFAVAVVDVSDGRNAPLVMINPRIVAQRGRVRGKEGCLSVPGYRASIARAEVIELAALDRCGQPFTLTAYDFQAAAIQHELDHLAGRVFVDHLPRWRQRWVYWRHPQWLQARPQS